MACEEEDSTIELCPENATVSPTPGAIQEKGSKQTSTFAKTYAVLFQSNIFDHEPKS